MSATAPIYRGWFVALSAVCGIMFGITVLGTVTFGYFVGPLREEFGWTETQVASALSVYLTIVAIALPVIGRLVDRYGARRIVLGSLVLYAAAIASLSLQRGSLAQLYLTYGAVALLGAGVSPVPFARALSLWFDRRRGLALGIALTGGGLGLSVLPKIAQALIGEVGWRGAYVGLALLVLLVGLPIAWLFLRDRPTPEEAGRELGDAPPKSGSANAAPMAGLEVREATATRAFWIMALSFTGLGLAIAGCNAYVPRILMNAGFSAGEASNVQVAMGLAAILGRLAGGYLMDRLYAPLVAFASALSAVFAMLLLTGASGFGLLAIVIGVLLGFATGVEGDVVSYLTSRFFGPRRFAELYGWLAFAYLAGGAAGPLLMGRSIDTLGSYDRGLYVFAGALFAGSVLLLFLGPYRFGGRRGAADGAMAQRLGASSTAAGR
jgi:MFS family permease